MEETHSLDYDQVEKLYRVLTEPIDIYPADNFPTLSIAPASFVKVVRTRLVQKGIQIRDIRMNGSAASYCLCKDSDDQPPVRYNDIDLIFGVSIERENDFHVIKEEVLTSLLEFFPEEVAKENIGSQLLEETYMKKMVLVSDANNRWSLFSLGCQPTDHISIELKFVSEIKRRFEFTVDSFQIILDSYFDFGQCAEESPVSVTPTFFPSVQAISVYSNYTEALDHLNNRLIHTVAPEEIRGGGLLKYCSLLVNGYRPAYKEKMMSLEPYMCSRFFIDFPSAEMQHSKIMKCAQTRFLQRGDVLGCVNFLDVLYNTVSSQARCLMESQKYETISVILRIRHMIVFPYSYYCPFPQPCVPISGFGGGSTSSYHHHHTQSGTSNEYHYYHHHHSNQESSRTSPPPPPNSSHWHHHRRPNSYRRNYHNSHHPRSRSSSPRQEPWMSENSLTKTAQSAEVRS
jgi:hypothetical protein